MSRAKDWFLIMIEKLSFWTFFVLIFVSCENKIEDPEIDQSTMSNILEEIYLLENHYQMQYGSPALYKPFLDSACIAVIQKYGYSKNDFETSFHFYSKSPGLLFDIQQRIIRSIETKKAKLN